MENADDTNTEHRGSEVIFGHLPIRCDAQFHRTPCGARTSTPVFGRHAQEYPLFPRLPTYYHQRSYRPSLISSHLRRFHGVNQVKSGHRSKALLIIRYCAKKHTTWRSPPRHYTPHSSRRGLACCTWDARPDAAGGGGNLNLARTEGRLQVHRSYRLSKPGTTNGSDLSCSCLHAYRIERRDSRTTAVN